MNLRFLGGRAAGGAVCLAILWVMLAGCALQRAAWPPPGTLATAPDSVRVWTQRLTLPTYAVRPDPIPRFEPLDDDGFYPYSAQGDIVSKPQPQIWTVICMENKYLRVMVMPELGGRLFALYDKTGRFDAIYRQGSIKPARVGIRGAWTCGGVEFNFPDGHSVTTHDEVHWTTRTYPDGSAAILVGDVERISRMGWTVELRLHPGRALLEDRVLVCNRTPLRQRGVYWSNAAVEANDRTQVIFPYPKVTGHSADVLLDFPRRNGTDFSWYRSYPSATSVFGVGGGESFIGVYDHGRDTGLVHFADRRELPGRKFWTWGNSEAGLRWAKVLSDDNRPYVELQAGPLVTQIEWDWIEPYQTHRYSEYWIPVSRIGPFARANPEVALRLTVDQGRATVGVLPTRAVPGAKIELRCGSRVLQAWRLDLAPEQPLLQSVDLAGSDPGSLYLLVRDGTGKLLIEHHHGQYATGPIPPELAPPSPGRVDASTPAGAARRADLLWLEGRPSRATRQIESALASWSEDPHVQLLAVELRLRQGLPDKASEILGSSPAPASARADQQMTDQAATRMYLAALARMQAGDVSAAGQMLADLHEHLVSKAESPLARSTRILLARCLMAYGRHDAAIRLLQPILRTQPDDAYVAALFAAAARRSGKTDLAGQTVKRYLAQPDLEPMARLEAQLATGQADPTLRRMLLRDPDVPVELACDYIGIGDWATARDVLVGACGDAAQSGMTWLIAAWCAEHLGRADEAAEYRARAEAQPMYLVFPSRPEELAAAQAALRADPRTARAAWYAGLVLMRWGRFDEAAARFEQAVAARDDNPLAHRCLAAILSAEGKDPAPIRSHLERAVQLEPREPQLWLDLARLLDRLDNPGQAADLLEQGLRTAPATDALVEALVSTYLQMARYREATAALASHTFSVTEHRYGIHQDYAAAWFGLALQSLLADQPGDALGALDKALEYPDNLAIGRPANPDDEAAIQFWRGVALRMLGRADAAQQAFDAAVAQRPRDRFFRYGDYYGLLNTVHYAMALRLGGRMDAFREELARLQAASGENHRFEHPEWGDWVRTFNDLRLAWGRALQDPAGLDALAEMAAGPKVPATWGRLCELVIRNMRKHAHVIDPESEAAAAKPSCRLNGQRPLRTRPYAYRPLLEPYGTPRRA